MAEKNSSVPATGWAAADASGFLSPLSFSRRCPKDDDVTIKILFCGICHTDVHVIKNDWGNAMYPIVPGHEIVGVVTAVGNKVEKFKVGEKVGVGYMVDSCLSCENCNDNSENLCDKMVPTSNGVDFDGNKTHGGFADVIVVKEHFVIPIPEKLPLEKAAPLLCAGITVYVPMMQYGLNAPGKHLGVVGLGGLGHVAVKFGKAFGMKVTVISTSESKEKEAIEHLGADSFLISKDPEKMKAAVGTMDGIIDTVSAYHPISPLILLLKARGKLIMTGAVPKSYELLMPYLVGGAKILAGTLIGGIKDTQEMLEFAAEHNISAEVEVVGMDYVNKALERLVAGDVRYRFVIDVANTLQAAT